MTRSVASIRLGSIGLAATLLSALAATGCAGDESLAPVGDGSGGGSTTGATTTGGDLPDPEGPPPPPVREVFQRDPFGNVKEAQNLLWDGDFEWQSAFADQYGWSEGFGFTLLQPVVGPECRSGLKCARVGSESSILGIGMSSAVADLYVSGWVRPSDIDCHSIDFLLIPDGVPDDAFPAEVPPVEDERGEDGWCRYQVIAPQRDAKSFVHVGVPTPGSTAIVDDVVLRRATEEESRSIPRAGVWLPDARLAARVEDAHEAIRRRRGPQEGRPDPLRAALERFGRGERPMLEAAPRRTPRAAP